MKRKTYLLSIPIMLVLLGSLAGCIRGVTGDSPAPVDEMAEDGSSHVTVDPRVEAALQVDESIKVLISLRDIDEIAEIPMAEWTEELLSGIDWDLRAQHAQEVQANVRAALGPEDATEVTGFRTMPGLSATITAFGLEKLLNHPDVVAIGAALLGALDGIEVGLD